MNTKLIDFKEALRKGMIDSFQRDGYLVPIMFCFKDGQPFIGQIPVELLSSQEGKEVLAGIIRNISQEPAVLCAGLIMEASGAKLEVDDELSKLVLDGSIRVSELKHKQDLITMIFSTPEGEELIAYEVDCDNKTVGELFGSDAMEQLQGTFTNFFSWNKN
jgi:hypothetical protein